MSWDDEIFTTIVLFFTFTQINIRGRNLETVVQALRLRKCEYLREWHEQEYQRPANGEPVITSIEFVVKDLATSSLRASSRAATRADSPRPHAAIPQARRLPSFHPHTLLCDWGDGHGFRIADALTGVAVFGAPGRERRPDQAATSPTYRAGFGRRCLAKADERRQWQQWRLPRPR